MLFLSIQPSKVIQQSHSPWQYTNVATFLALTRVTKVYRQSYLQCGSRRLSSLGPPYALSGCRRQPSSLAVVWVLSTPVAQGWVWSPRWAGWAYWAILRPRWACPRSSAGEPSLMVGWAPACQTGPGPVWICRSCGRIMLNFNLLYWFHYYKKFYFWSLKPPSGEDDFFFEKAAVLTCLLLQNCPLGGAEKQHFFVNNPIPEPIVAIALNAKTLH